MRKCIIVRWIKVMVRMIVIRMIVIEMIVIGMIVMKMRVTVIMFNKVTCC